jgi:nitroimidazol reductase NimA-like FMN-containing flavoprotein (pyridoxamine 5'-phosphate oxidase superfamily)
MRCRFGAIQEMPQIEEEANVLYERMDKKSKKKNKNKNKKKGKKERTGGEKKQRAMASDISRKTGQ